MVCPQYMQTNIFFAFHPLNSNLFYECNDGGLYATNDSGITWYDLSNGLEISQIYRLGTSATISTNVIVGLQDNGSREIYSGQWYEQTGGDGMECIIDYSDANIEYASYAQGVIYRTYDFWANQTTISDNIPGQPQGAWVTPFVIDPVNPQTLYAGYNNLYKTTNRGDSWTQISNLGSADKLISLAVAPSNPLTIYTATFDTLYTTSDGGSSWYYAAPNTSLNMTYIAVHSNDPLTLWITFSGYTAGQKVYKSTDGGATWTNISGTLPNVPVNCIVYETGSNDDLYIGTDVGVYYRDASMTDWIQYNTSLPNVVVTELEIQKNTNKLWAATFGRGLWRSDLYSTSIGIDNQIFNNSISIQPNPTTGTFILNLNNNQTKIVSIEVYNILGAKIRHIKQSEISGNEITIDLQEQTDGIYYVQINTEKGKIIEKIILNK